MAIDPRKKSMSPKVVGQSARRIAELAGITVPEGTRALIARLKGVGEDHPLSREKLCPILGFYTVQALEEGVNLCTDLMHFGGLGHTAVIFSQDSEVRILETLRASEPSRSHLVVSHRPETIRACDRIVVVDQGRIVEAGRHDELVARRGPYQYLIDGGEPE